MKTTIWRRLALIPVLASALSGSAFATAFTFTSPADGTLPAGTTQVGGIVLDVVGLNGIRLVSQLSASSLYQGFATGDPLVIGVQTGLTAALTGQLGGGISELAVRVTLFDGDTGPGDFDDNQNTFLLNGITIGNWSDVVTNQTDATGTNTLSTNPSGGFRNEILDTGWFYVTNGALLTSIYNSIVASTTLQYALHDTDPLDNFYDFKQGVNGSLIDVEQAPIITPPGNSVPDGGGTMMMLSAAFGGVVMLRRRFLS